MPSRFARLVAAYRATRAVIDTIDAPAPAPAPRSQDAIAEALDALREELAALRDRITATPAPTTPTPAGPDLTPVLNAIDELAPDPGPFRAHLERVADRLLRAPGATPATVAATILTGEDS